MNITDAVYIAIITGIFSIGGALGGAYISARFARVTMQDSIKRQLEADRLADKRRMRDAKRDRVRDTSKALLNAAITMNDTLIDQQMVLSGETPQQRDARLLERWQRVMPPSNSALLELSLDVDSEEVLSTFNQIRAAYQRYQSGRAANVEQPNTVPSGELSEYRDEVGKGVTQSHGLLRNRTAELETPI